MANDLGMKRKAISELVVGDLVDLENDIYADKGKCPEFEFELQEVESIEVETPTCTAVYFVNAPCVGFPPDHTVAFLPGKYVETGFARRTVGAVSDETN